MSDYKHFEAYRKQNNIKDRGFVGQQRSHKVRRDSNTKTVSLTQQKPHKTRSTKTKADKCYKCRMRGHTKADCKGSEYALAMKKGGNRNTVLLTLALKEKTKNNRLVMISEDMKQFLSNQNNNQVNEADGRGSSASAE